jgi:hypothetical protein
MRRGPSGKQTGYHYLTDNSNKSINLAQAWQNFIIFFSRVPTSSWPQPCQTGSDIFETGTNLRD